MDTPKFEPVDYSEDIDEDMLYRTLIISLAIDDLESYFEELPKHQQEKLSLILERCVPMSWPRYIKDALYIKNSEFWLKCFTPVVPSCLPMNYNVVKPISNQKNK